jgi:hypothetical protein
MRRLSVFTAGLALFAGPWATVSARADPAMDVVCSSTVRVFYSPGQSDGVTAVDTYDPCESTDSTLISGKRHLQSSSTDTCNTKASGAPGKEEIVWSNGKVSTWEYTKEVEQSNGSIIIHQKGKITAGEFVGDSANEDLTLHLPGAYLHGAFANGDPNNCPAPQGGTDPAATGRLQIGRS